MPGSYACIRFERNLWETIVKPAIEKVGPIIGADSETKAGRVEIVEQIFRMVNDCPLERLKKELG